MTIAAEFETRIGRPVAAVFAELTALERYPEWLIASGIIGVERLDDGPLAAGSRLRVQQRVAGRSATLEGVVTVHEPDERFGFEARDSDGVKVDVEASLAADADGLASILRWSIRVGLPLRFRMLEGMVAPQARRAAALDLEAFKRRLEAVAQG
jgi:uncharacterized protein YndB with AHSA1/START domain